MTRRDEFELVKYFVKDKIKDGNCGLFNIRNLVGDEMRVLFEGKYFNLEICEKWGYFELFGANENEWSEINYLYASICDNPFYRIVEE